MTSPPPALSPPAPERTCLVAPAPSGIAAWLARPLPLLERARAALGASESR